MVSGAVHADNGEPLAGVTIKVKDGDQTVLTDAKGAFSIRVASPDATLVFTSVGYDQLEIKLDGRRTLDVRLKSKDQQLSEVVVIGYGTQRKRDLTGSISTISAEEISKSAVLSVDQALQGRAAGVFVNQSSSAPGGGIAVRIRGGNSIQGGNEPLYVIDGIPIYSDNNEVNPGGGRFTQLRTSPNALSSLNPMDIESIEILKDASATAIYGSRGANGVVLITTKKGKSGKSRLEFGTYQGLQNIAKKVEVADASLLMKWANEGAGTEVFSEAEIQAPSVNTDWQDLILRSNAPIANYQLTASGGSEKIRYLISGNYFDQDGIIKRSNFKRYSGRLNLDATINSWLKLGSNMFVTQTENNQAFDGGSGNSNSSALFSSLVYIPMLPVYNPTTGNYSRREDGIRPNFSPYGRLNPVQLVNEVTDLTSGNRNLGDIFADITLTKGVNFRSSFGYDLDNRDRDYYFSNYKEPGNRQAEASLGKVKALSLINTNYLTYNKGWGDHQLTFTGVYEVQKRTVDRSFISNSVFSNNITQFYDIGAGTQAGGPTVSSNRTQWTMQSYLGRINYNLKNRYLLTVSARADGSSKFGAQNRWAYFPSAALAWKVSDEKFFQSIGVISTAKLRVSAGKTGNQEIGVNRAITTYIRGNYSFGGNVVNNYIPRVGNQNLKWETTNQYDAGLDLGFFNDRINLTVDAYYKKTFDLLMTYNIPVELGYSSTIGNVGKLENKGLEIALNAKVIDRKNLSWSTTINWAGNRNKVLDLGASTELRGGVISYDYGGTFSAGNLVRVGESIGSFYGLIYQGVYRNSEDLAKYPQTYNGNAPKIGSAIYKDVAGPVDANGKLTGPDGRIDANDRVILGSPAPKGIFGWANTFSYKAIQLTAFIQGVYGNKILNLNRRDLYDENYQHNISRDRIENAWRIGNETAALYPKANAEVGVIQRIPSGAYSDFFLEDGSYLRLKDLRLSVDLQMQKLQKAGLDVSVYVAGQNLVTLTKYTGYNPETNQQGQDNINQGIDMGSYPLAKTIMVGVNLSF